MGNCVTLSLVAVSAVLARCPPVRAVSQAERRTPRAGERVGATAKPVPADLWRREDRGYLPATSGAGGGGGGKVRGGTADTSDLGLRASILIVTASVSASLTLLSQSVRATTGGVGWLSHSVRCGVALIQCEVWGGSHTV